MKLPAHPPVCGSPGPACLRTVSGGAGGRRRGFTLIEMLVVLGIIGILAAMALPSIKGTGRGNLTEAATRQLMDDLAFARLKAMSQRMKVYVVFAPDLDWFTNVVFGGLNTNFLFYNSGGNTIAGGQLSSYAMFSPRMVGDQPGQSTPRYLSEWHSLPSGAFIPAALFRNRFVFHNLPSSPQTNFIPLDETAPATTSVPLPYIAFDEAGRLFGRTTNITLAVVEGSIMHLKDSTGQTNLVVNTDAVETAEGVPPVGGIIAGVSYLVLGPPGSVAQYPPAGLSYPTGSYFTGTTASADYAVAAGSPKVVQLYGVRLDWVTGRAKAVKPELP